MYIEIDELKTHLHGENIQAISGDDPTLLIAAIDAAISETRGYLADFDRDTIFATTGSSRNALLLVFIKDIAVWHYINLCNAGTELKLRQDRYERAIDWLKAVQKGNVSPDLPKASGGNENNPATGTIIFGSNPKREQHF